jgi:hypothetical protein
MIIPVKVYRLNQDELVSKVAFIFCRITNSIPIPIAIGIGNQSGITNAA